MYISGNRQALLIGETTDAHHQIELACDSCHTSGPFSSAKKFSKDMNKACLTCHEDELDVSNDSHPVKKFRDPRNIARREILDALYCATCHVEHKPEITGISAVTLPMDFCSACHQEIEEERPSHAGLGFETCATAGCHNYHDNTGLYEQFLVKHAEDPPHASTPISHLASIARSPMPIETALQTANSHSTLYAELIARFSSEVTVEDKTNVQVRVNELLDKVLLIEDALAPAKYLTADATSDWSGSLHAISGVNCTGCHLSNDTDINATNIETVIEQWVEKPGIEHCSTCHKAETNTYLEGKHGMRFHPELAGPRSPKSNNILSLYALELFPEEPMQAMKVHEARLPMKESAHMLETGNCNTCHEPHQPDLRTAAVEACISCHDDEHSNNYFNSTHYALWQAELAGTAEHGSGVSCADCHMPKLEARTGREFYTTHNQNAYLKPNEKMIRPVCQSCHGLGFAIDALADIELVRDNFSRPPTVHIESIDWALDAQKQ